MLSTQQLHQLREFCRKIICFNS